MKPLTVDLGNRSYPIHIDAGLLDDGALIRDAVGDGQVMIVSNDRVAPLYLDRIAGHLRARECRAVVLPDGEAFKTLESFDEIVTALLRHRFDRGCTLVALGGGVIGDLTGFAAACYQRGVAYVQIPTTLLAQVDSAVGGKTAVNHALGKNMIGAFHQPRAVIADTHTLETLDERELRAGAAEIIKYGLAGDEPFFTWFEMHAERVLARDPAALAHAIRRSCENKAAIVAADERETGRRAILNLGHTFGHAIETGLGYGAWLHGEAVAAGMCMAAALSRRLGWMTGDDHARVCALVDRCRLPTAPPPALGVDVLMNVMAVDKKNRGGRIRLVLLCGIGAARVTDDYDREALHATLVSRGAAGV